MPALRGMPLGAALLESLLVSVMKTLQLAASGAGVRQTGTSDTHPGRRSSYTEQALAAAIEPSSPSGLVSPLLKPLRPVRLKYATVPSCVIAFKSCHGFLFLSSYCSLYP